jgi:hypothetical protein
MLAAKPDFSTPSALMVSQMEASSPRERALNFSSSDMFSDYRI